MVDISVALNAVGAGIKILKGLNELDHALDKADLKIRIAELSGSLATAQLALAEAQSELAEKDQKIKKLTDSFASKEKLIEFQGYFYRKDSQGHVQGRPYCPRCLEKGTQMMTVGMYKPGRPLSCPECKSEYSDVAEYGFESSQ